LLAVGAFSSLADCYFSGCFVFGIRLNPYFRYPLLDLSTTFSVSFVFMLNAD
jgi:hypothetical protein